MTSFIAKTRDRAELTAEHIIASIGPLPISYWDIHRRRSLIKKILLSLLEQSAESTDDKYGGRLQVTSITLLATQILDLLPSECVSKGLHGSIIAAIVAAIDERKA